MPLIVELQTPEGFDLIRLELSLLSNQILGLVA